MSQSITGMFGLKSAWYPPFTKKGHRNSCCSHQTFLMAFSNNLENLFCACVSVCLLVCLFLFVCLFVCFIVVVFCFCFTWSFKFTKQFYTHSFAILDHTKKDRTVEKLSNALGYKRSLVIIYE